MVLLQLFLLVTLSQLILDDAHLLAEVVVPLPLIDALLHLLLDLGLQLQNMKLPPQENGGLLQPLEGMELLENPLLVGIVDGGVLGDIIGNIARILGREQSAQAVLDRAPGELEKMLIERLCLPKQRLCLR